MPQRFYRPELDVIRLVAFLAVFLYHGLTGNAPSPAVDNLEYSWSFGLCLFFTLSAYLITTLLVKEQDKSGTIDLPRFYKRRALRIWPLYFGALALSAAGAALHHQLKNNGLWYLAALVMLGNVVQSQPTTVMHLWSISVEEQFYVFWPTLMRRLTRRHLVVAALLLLAVSNGAMAYFGAVHADTRVRVWWNSLVQMEFFAAGILLALRDAQAARPTRHWLVRAAGLPLVPVLWFAAVAVFHVQGGDHHLRGPWSACTGFALVAISCALLIDLARGMDRWPKPIVYLGKISYGLYVFHAPILDALRRTRLHESLLDLPVALGLTIGIAWLSYTFFETPFLRLKEKYEVVQSRPVE